MAQSNIEVKISLSQSFLESFEDLPKSLQKKTREFITKFQENPLASSINYETIANASNEDLRSVRIDQSYRGIVLKPKTGNTYYLLWVDKHDNAYDWATSKKIDSKEILGTDYIDTKFKTTTVNEVKKSILQSTSIVDLVKLGIPLELIDLIREINDINELDKYKDSLEIKVYLKLQYYLNGYSLKDLNDLVDDKEEKTNPFVMVDDLSDSELQDLINSPLSKWRLFLHPKQLKLANMNFSGSAKVIGSAGTGKTVVAVHRIKHLLKKLENNERILFTTYTRTLADDIKSKVYEMISKPDRELVDISNIDSLLFQYIKRNRLSISVIEDTDRIWHKAIKDSGYQGKYSIDFIKEEWEMVILAKDTLEIDQYLVVPREFRVKKIDRQTRAEIWNIVEAYRKEMRKSEVYDIEWAKIEVIKHLEKKYPEGYYRYIVLDEAQDIGSLSFKLIRALAGKEKANDIFIVGDSRQRIYRNKTTLKSCGINVTGNSYSLNINYRTTDSIYDFASNVLEGCEFDDLNGDLIKDELVQSVIIGNTPEVIQFEEIDDEVNFIRNYIDNLVKSDSKLNEICICLRTNDLVDKYDNELQRRDIKTLKLSSHQSDNIDLDGVRITTMHRVKGLEFSHIILAGLHKDVMPLASLLTNVEGEIERDRVLLTEKSLLYVAMTRARYSLMICSSGNLSDFIAIKM